MIRALTLLMGCQLAATLIARALGLPVPGAVLAMAALFVFLACRRHIPADVEGAASTLLRHLGLLFIPAGVGVIRHLETVQDQALALAVTVITSTLAALLVTATVLQRLLATAGEEEQR